MFQPFSRSYFRVSARSAVLGLLLAAITSFGSSSPAAATVWTSNTTLKSCTGNTLQDIDVSDDGQVVAAVAQSGYLCVSVDGGSTFTKRAYSSATSEWRSVDVSPNGQYIVAAFYYGPGVTQGGIWWSNDSANDFATWTDVTPHESSGPRFWDVSMSADGQKLITCGDVYNGSNGASAYYSTDAGTSWSLVYGSNTKRFTGCAISGDGNVLYASGGGQSGSSNLGGVFKSVDGGKRTGQATTPIKSSSSLQTVTAAWLLHRTTNLRRS